MSDWISTKSLLKMALNQWMHLLPKASLWQAYGKPRTRYAVKFWFLVCGKAEQKGAHGRRTEVGSNRVGMESC